mmetsp:Transcript_44750/g.82918  ORF Transcript_44750/g.82918 Transcript_44750/m.82918 type:complete len:271 (-) Transcript_44750:929-1741(-)
MLTRVLDFTLFWKLWQNLGAGDVNACSSFCSSFFCSFFFFPVPTETLEVLPKSHDPCQINRLLKPAKPHGVGKGLLLVDPLRKHDGIQADQSAVIVVTTSSSSVANAVAMGLLVLRVTTATMVIKRTFHSHRVVASFLFLCPLAWAALQLLRQQRKRVRVQQEHKNESRCFFFFFFFFGGGSRTAVVVVNALTRATNGLFEFTTTAAFVAFVVKRCSVKTTPTFFACWSWLILLGLIRSLSLSLRMSLRVHLVVAVVFAIADERDCLDEF